MVSPTCAPYVTIIRNVPHTSTPRKIDRTPPKPLLKYKTMLHIVVGTSTSNHIYDTSTRFWCFVDETNKIPRQNKWRETRSFCARELYTRDRFLSALFFCLFVRPLSSRLPYLLSLISISRFKQRWVTVGGAVERSSHALDNPCRANDVIVIPTVQQQ